MARVTLFGIPVSPGICIGKALILRPSGAPEERTITPAQYEAEKETLYAAASRTRDELTAICDQIPDACSEQYDIIKAHIQLCQDKKLLQQAEKYIAEEYLCASWALHKTIESLCALFQSMEDPYLRDRAQDIKSVGQRIQAQLTGQNTVQVDPDTPHILVADDISPADTLALSLSNLLGIVTTEGGPTSHMAILAHSLRIPAIVGVTGLFPSVQDGDSIIIDALRGRVHVAPDEDEVALLRQHKQDYADWEHRIVSNACLPAETRDGIRVSVQANIENPEECAAALASGAEGIGLYRTEFAYLRQSNLPDEEQLYQEYKSAAEQISPKRLVFRTLDAGADKMLGRQTALKEPNPALGLRGIRFCLRNRNIFYTQLRALMRAGMCGNIALMIPMVTGIQEVQEVRRLLVEVAQSLSAAGIPHKSDLPVGVMIETPSAVMIADALARECDFFSIGSNDLIHYTLGIDRNNKHVAYLHDPLHPAIVRSLKHVIDCAHREGIGVSACGELSADPGGLLLLLGMGVDSLSATPAYVPSIKHMLRMFSIEDCTELAHSVLMSTDTVVSTRMVQDALNQYLREEFSFHASMLQSIG